MKTLRIGAVVALMIGLAVLIVQQRSLSTRLNEVSDRALSGPVTPASERQQEAASPDTAALERRLDLLQSQIAAADVHLAALTNRLAAAEQKLFSSFNERVRDLPDFNSNTAPAKRSWGPEQLIGPPDTHSAGDIPTAWAPREQDGGVEWIKLEYEKPVQVAEVRVRETHNPGAIFKVSAVLPNGQEAVIWSGSEPAAEAPIETSFEAAGRIHAQSIKVYLDTTRVTGWNEIDAVELVGRDGSRQWARAASASSTYAERNSPAVVRFDAAASGDLLTE